jgi:4-amino-4-deoxy-L-arabinose transferase-like glycosyltransferase
MDNLFSTGRNRTLVPIILLLIIGFSLRLISLDKYPMQVNQDELSNIYDGYCISETGADRWGEKNPIILTAFGDFDNRPPLYAYLAALSIKLFGYSIAAGRLPSAIIGCISLILLFLTTSKLGGRMYGIICLLIATFSPWHIIFSRLAHEGTILPPFFIIATIYLWMRASEKIFSSSSLILLGLTIGLATNAYQATKLIFLILAIIFGIEMLRKTNYNFKKISILTLFVIIGALPQIIASILYPDRFFSRANDQLVPFSLTLGYAKEIATNLLNNFDPKHLFLSFGEFNNLSVGRRLTVEMFFFYFGLIIFYFVFKSNKKINIYHIYAIFFVTILPAAITKDNPHALRASASILLYPLFSGIAIYFLFEQIKIKKIGGPIIILTLLLFAFNGFYNVNKYLNNKSIQAQGAQYGQVAMYNGMNKFHKKYENVHIQLYGAFQYLFVASYTNMHPKEFQTTEKIYEKKGWYNLTKLGKFQFLSADEIKKSNEKPQNGKNLLVLLEKTNKYTLLDSVSHLGEKIYYYEN